jgi:hypothetical protein
MNTSTDKSGSQLFVLRQNKGFKVVRPEDDLLHPASFVNIKDDSATETQYFGFSVPEEKIHGYAYMWHHPNLKVCTGGLVVFQGIKATTLHAELCDYRTFMSDAALKNDLHEFRFDNGYGVKIIEPLKRFHMTYADPARKNSVDLMIEAVQPVVLFDDGRHFEQTMQTTGELVLRGRCYRVDCFSIRDRSWGAPRPETVLDLPPLSWMCVTFSKDFAFNCSAFDQASGNPGPFALPEERALSGGWVHLEGKLGRIVQARKRVTRQNSTVCAALELGFSDEHGRTFEVRASLSASCPLILWNNTWTVINMMRWQCNGLVGDGTNQEGFWNGYLTSRL